jgi:hypothetical protein
MAALVAREASARIDDLVGYRRAVRPQCGRPLAVARERRIPLPRIVHVSGDRAGAEVTRTLAAALSPHRRSK